MIPAAFDYQRAATLDEALGARRRGRLGEGARRWPEPPAAAEAAARVPDKLVDIGRLAELKGVRQLDGRRSRRSAR